MARKAWTIQLEDGYHKVEYEYSPFSVKRAIYVDGRLIERINGAYFDPGSDYPFSIGPHSCYIRTRPKGFTNDHDLVVNGWSINTMQPMQEPMRQAQPIPPWAWAFIGACILLPIVTRGGAIWGAIGFGCAGGCAAISRNSAKSAPVRALLCAAVTIACWAPLIALSGAIAAGGLTPGR